MGEFDLVTIKIGYLKLYCPTEKALGVMLCLQQAGMMYVDDIYKNSRIIRVAKPVEEGFISMELADPAKAFSLIRAYEDHMRDE
jgi:hypothetical protein